MRPLLLLSNDDGIHAPGLDVLAVALEQIGDVVVIAPERERSAASHAITLHKPLRPRKVAPHKFSISGTPVDCVYVGLLRLAPRPPALVVSGVNNGPNLGSDVFYSGTVAAAAEGALRGIPAVAFSQSLKGDPQAAAGFAAALCARVIEHGLPSRTMLNVNVPAAPDGRYRWTRLGARVYRDLVDERTDPRGRSYYWIGGPNLDTDGEPDSDGEAVKHGVISVTPMRLELTAHELLDPPPAWVVAGYNPVA